MFHQVEGLVIDRTSHMGHLKGCLIEFCRAFFGLDDLPVRFRPSYFPFTEPSAEMDVECQLCHGSGCPGCKGTGWMEILGSGMVHPSVLNAAGLDGEKYTGWAFGMGPARIAMLRYDIPDIRILYDSDVRFLYQISR
jgi:phenylalanyl-tRNA synthetase alpha chain